MVNKGTIEELYAKEICKHCKNRNKCQEELRRKLDNSIKCEYYEKEY